MTTLCWISLPAGLRQMDIGYEQFKQLPKNYISVWAVRSRHIVTIWLNRASPNFFTYLPTYLLTQILAVQQVRSGHHQSLTDACVSPPSMLTTASWLHHVPRCNIISHHISISSLYKQQD